MKPHFSIRDVGWLTLVVAILLVWWLDHQTLENRSRFTVETIRASDGEPTVLRDQQQPGVILIRDSEGWKTAWELGQQPPPPFKPE